MTRLASASVIVPCLGWTEELARCLDALASQSATFPIQTIVVINRAEVGPLPVRPGVQFVVEPVRGPASARNSGVRAATGDILAFTDTDCVPHPQWMEALVESIEVNGRRSVIAGAITRSGSRRNAVSLYDSVTFLKQEDYVKWCGAFVTANLAMHRDVWNRVGPFDPLFNEAAFEDWDWALRVRKVGIRICYEPKAVVDHPCMSHLRELRTKVERLARGEILFTRKHGRPRKRKNLEQMASESIRRAWKAPGADSLDRLQLAGISALAAYWRWAAFSQPAARLRQREHVPWPL